MDPKDALINNLRGRVSELEAENSRLLQQFSLARSSLLKLGVTPDNEIFAKSGEKSNEKQQSLSTSTLPGASTACENCDRLIPLHALPMHILHCKRNIVKCIFCNAKVSSRDLESHVETARGTLSQLYSWAALGNLLLISSALQHGAKDASGNVESALHIAAKNRRFGVVELLLSSGWAVNSVNANGETPLHSACGSRLQQAEGLGGNLDDKSDTLSDIVSLLLRFGADVEACTGIGDTCIQVAQRAKNLEILSLISAAGGTLRPSSRDPNASKSRPGSARMLLAPL
jgi:ankyrin repeat protein